MEAVFISNKPWVDETIRLRKMLFFSTIFMIVLGVIIEIIGIALLAYMEFVVGVIALVFGAIIPLGYVGANTWLLAKRRRDYDKNMIIEYRFTDDALEIIKLSDSFKSKDVIDYSNMRVNKVFDKSRFIVLKTKSYYADYIVLRKNDIRLADGENKNQAIVSFISFLMAKVAEANRAGEITSAEPAQNIDEIESEIIGSDIVDVPQDAETDAIVEDKPLEETLEVADALDEDADKDIMTLEYRVENDPHPELSNAECIGDMDMDENMPLAEDDLAKDDLSNDDAKSDDIEDKADANADLFSYDEQLVDSSETDEPKEYKTPYLHDYTYGEDKD